MSLETMGTLLAFVCAPAVNLFVLLYATTAKPWASWTGRAIIISKIGLAGLVDVAVLFRAHHMDVVTPEPFHGYYAMRLISFGFITVGTYLYLFAYVREQFLMRHPHEEHS